MYYSSVCMKECRLALRLHELCAGIAFTADDVRVCKGETET